VDADGVRGGGPERGRTGLSAVGTPHGHGQREAEGRFRVSEIVVVEGLHDRQRVEAAVAADVWVVGGDRVSRRVLSELRRAGARRGLIILTDPDGPGERIRRRIDEAVTGCKHAFIPRAKATDGRRIGVEHASLEAIRDALQKARQNTDSKAVPKHGEDAKGSEGPVAAFTLDDLVAHGLAGAEDAALRRRLLGDRLGIGYANAKAFLRKLNLLGVTRAEWQEAVADLGLADAETATRARSESEEGGHRP
jgi:ribonuclease M5